MTALPALERIAWLERARKAETDADVLLNVLGAWRATPLVALCELVEVAGVRARRGRAMPRQIDQPAWRAAARRHDAAELDWVIANLQTRRVDEARERADLLAKWPVDPRVPTALLRLLPRTAMRGRTSRPFWTAVFRIVHRRFHAGIAPAIVDVDAADLDGDFGDYVDAKLRSLRRRLETHKEPALDAPTRELIAAIRTKLEIETTAAAAKSLDDFLREVWAAPLDDGVREVFADWLIARGDPRGEFIMLQITRKRRGLDIASQKREAALLKEHARAWMGPLEPAIDRKQFRFEGGFLWGCKINVRGMTPALLEHPAWSTVREYVLEGANEAYFDGWLDRMIAFGAKRR